MAKKRKDTPEEEELDFKLPQFDEEKFLKRERRNIKTLFICFIFGFLIGLISFGLWVLMTDSVFRWELALLFGVVNGIWIRYLFQKLNIDLSDFGRKGWITSYATYFVTWIFILIVLVNPPFYDGESPQIELAVLPGMQEIGGTIQMTAVITDNVGINTNDITFNLIFPDGTNQTPTFSFDNKLFNYTYTNPENIMGDYTYILSATDLSGHTTESTGAFSYSNNTLSIISSRFNNIRSGDPIVIRADTDIKVLNQNFLVYYTVDDGQPIPVNKKSGADDEYETSARYQGWIDNRDNITVTVYAEVSHYFINIPTKFTNTIKDTKIYDFSTDVDDNIGTQPRLLDYNCTRELFRQPQEDNTINYNLPCPRTIAATPGFELLTLCIALGVAFIVFKKKRNNTTK